MSYELLTAVNMDFFLKYGAVWFGGNVQNFICNLMPEQSRYKTEAQYSQKYLYIL